MRQSSSSPSVEGSSSFTHLLLVWVLVGSSFAGLGWALADAIPVTAPLSSMGAGLFFGTMLVAVLWVAGFRPSLWASGGYCIATNGLQFLLVASSSLFVPSGATLSSWDVVVLRSLSIAIPAALIFTDLGRRVRVFVRKQGRKIAKTPPE